MAASRVKVARDKAELVQNLVASSVHRPARAVPAMTAQPRSNHGHSPFQTYADVLAFAAALGARRDKRVPVEAAAKEPAPISLEIFVSRGYDAIIRLLAIAQTQDPKILSNFDPQAEEQRVLIFEEYANGGLEILRDELRGAVDYSERLLLILSNERFKSEVSTEEFDLSRFL